MRRKTWLAVFGAAGLVAIALLVTRSAGPPPANWVTADELVLYSVDGRDGEEQERAKVVVTGETVRGYPVLGKVRIDDPTERRRLTAAFEAALTDGSPSKCFWPRHVVQVRHGGHTTEYVICFQCSTVAEWADGRPVRRKASHIDRSARPAFDAPLAAAGVPIAPD